MDTYQLSFFPSPETMTNKDYLALAEETKYYDNLLGNSFYNNTTSSIKSTELGNYVLGEQDIKQTKKKLSTHVERSTITAKINAPDDTLNWVHKIFTTIRSRLLSVQLEPVVKPIDKAFEQEKEQWKAKVMAYKALKDILTGHQAYLQELGLTEDDIPTKELEFELFLKRDYKWKYALKAYQEIERQLEFCKFSSKDETVVEIAITEGVFCAFNYIDQNNNFHLDVPQPAQVGYRQSHNSLFSEMDNIAYMVFLSLPQIAIEGNLTVEQVKEIADKANIDIETTWYNNYNSSLWLNSNSWPATTRHRVVPVIRFNRLLLHTDRYTAKPPAEGMPKGRYIKEKPNYVPGPDKINPVKSVYYAMWHQGCYVPICEMVYNCKPTPNQYINPLDPANPPRPFVFIRPLTINGKTVSVIQLVKPFQDLLTILYLHVQTLLGSYVIPGLAFDVTKIGQLQINGVTYSVQQFIDTYRTTGNLFYASGAADVSELSSLSQNPNPFSEAPRADIVNEIQRFLNLMGYVKQSMYEIVGTNDTLLGNNPNPDIGKAVTERAIQGGDHAIGHLYRGHNAFFEAICHNIITNWQYVLKTDPNEDLRKIASRELLVKVKNSPTEQIKQLILQAASEAIRGGLIDMSDFLEIVDIDNLDELKLRLKIALKNKEKSKMAEQSANMEQQAALNEQVAASTEKMRQQTQQSAIEAKLAEVQAKTKGEMDKLDKNHELQKDLLRFKAELDAMGHASKSEIDTEDKMALEQNKQLTQSYLADPAHNPEQPQDILAIPDEA